MQLTKPQSKTLENLPERCKVIGRHEDQPIIKRPSGLIYRLEEDGGLIFVAAAKRVARKPMLDEHEPDP